MGKGCPHGTAPFWQCGLVLSTCSLNASARRAFRHAAVRLASPPCNARSKVPPERAPDIMVEAPVVPLMGAIDPYVVPSIAPHILHPAVAVPDVGVVAALEP